MLQASLPQLSSVVALRLNQYHWRLSQEQKAGWGQVEKALAGTLLSTGTPPFSEVSGKRGHALNKPSVIGSQI